MSLSTQLGDRVFAVGVTASAFAVAAIGRGIGMVAAAAGAQENPVYAYGGLTVAVLGFAGLLVRQVVQGNNAWKDIVNSLRSQLETKDDDIAYITWEREQARWRAGERADPGPAPTRRSQP